MATTPSLRPLGVGEILDAGIKIYLRHWKPLMICVVGIVLPVQILTVLVLSSIDPNSIDYSFNGGTASSNGDPSASETAAFFAVAIISGLSTLLATAACFKAVADAWLGTTPEAGRSLRFGLRRLPILVWLTIVVGIGLVLAFVALVIPSIWLFVSWSLAVPVLLFERVGAFKAIGRSFRLVRHRWWPICGALLVAYLLAGIVGAVVQLIPSGIADAVAGDNDTALAVATIIGGTISKMITTPFSAAVITLLYFDQRVRKEGFDLQLLAEGLGTTRDPDAPLPEPLVGPDVTPEQRAAAPYWPPPPGWVPPDPSPPPPDPGRQWWQDPLPPAPEPGGTYGGGYARPEPRDEPSWTAADDAARDPSRAGDDAAGGEPSWAAPADAARDPSRAGDTGSDAEPSRAGDDAAGGGPSQADDSWAGAAQGGDPSQAGDTGSDAGPSRAGEAGDDVAGGGPSQADDSWAGAAHGGDPSQAGSDAEPSRAGDDASAGDRDVPPEGDRPAKPPKRDPNRADWLPPEAPRGPGGL